MATNFEIQESARSSRADKASEDARQQEIDQLEQTNSLPSPIRNRPPVNLEEELLEQQREEEERSQALEEQNQIDRIEQQNQRIEEAKAQSAPSRVEKTQNLANKAQTAYKWGSRAAKLYETAPVWGPIVAVLVGVMAIILLVVITVTSVKAVCDGSYTDSVNMAGAKAVVAWLPGDICAQLAALDSGQLSGQTIIVPPGPPPPGGGLKDAEARLLLSQANICNYPTGSSRNDCVNAAAPQTSLEGIQQATLNEIIRFKADCDLWARNNGGGICEVVVTGGTETTGGHAGGPCSHLSGNKVDIRPTTLINSYIATIFAPRGTVSGNPQYQNPNTTTMYVNEGSHWDVGGVGCT